MGGLLWALQGVSPSQGNLYHTFISQEGWLNSRPTCLLLAQVLASERWQKVSGPFQQPRNPNVRFYLYSFQRFVAEA